MKFSYQNNHIGQLPTVLFHYPLWSEPKAGSQLHLQYLFSSHSLARIHGYGFRSGKATRKEEKDYAKSRFERLMVSCFKD